MNCPRCNLDLNGKDIYEAMLEDYNGDILKAKHWADLYGWTPENKKCFRLEIGIEVPEYYDGVILWKCPDCGYVWKRFDWVDDKYLEEYGEI